MREQALCTDSILHDIPIKQNKKIQENQTILNNEVEVSRKEVS